MTTQEMKGLDPATILAEIDSATTRLINAAVVDQKKEFVSNVYPLLKLLTESAGHRFADLFARMSLLEEVVTEFISGAESMILPELAARIQATFAIGLKLCDEAIAGDGGVDPQLAILVEAFRASAKIAVQAVADVTAEEIEGDEDDDDEDDDQPVNGKDKELHHA